MGLTTRWILTFTGTLGIFWKSYQFSLPDRKIEKLRISKSMYNYLKIPAFDTNLTIQDHVSAMKSIQIFVDSYTLAECRDYLWNLLQSGLRIKIILMSRKIGIQ